MTFDLRGARPDEPLEKRIARIEDRDAIRNLWLQYTYLADTSSDGVEVTKLHTEDAVWEGDGVAPLGRYEGWAEIEPFITGFYQDCTWRHHHMTNMAIHVDDSGETAHMRASLIDFVKMKKVDDPTQDEAVLIGGDYVNDFVKVDGEWRIKHVRLSIHTMSNWDQGWVKQPNRLEG
jgi:hypothetical protein